MHRSLMIILAVCFVAACEKEESVYHDPFDIAGLGEPCGGMVFCEEGLFCTQGFCVTPPDTDTVTADIDKPPLPDHDSSDQPDPPDQPDGPDSLESPDEDSEASDIDWAGICEGPAVVNEQSLPYLAGCDAIEGDLIIEGTILPAVEQLHNIERIDGSLIIARNVLLNDLSGLRTLQSIGGSFAVEDNVRLIDLSDMLSLRLVSGQLRIKNNARLSQIALPALEETGSVWLERNRLLVGFALPTLTRVAGLFFLFDNDLISTLGGLPALQTLGELALQHNDGLIQISATPLPFISLSRLTVRGNPQLRSFTGLEGIVSIGDIALYDNPELASFKGLGALEQVAGSFSIEQCGIRSFAKLERLNRIDGDLILRRCDDLIHPGGPPALQTINGYLVVHRNAALEDLAGFPALQSIGGLSVIDNTLFGTLTGLETLSWIYGPFEIQNNPSLSTLDGLGNLRSVAGRFVLLNNPLLAGTTALTLLEQVLGDLALSYNDTLSDIPLPSFVSLGGNLYIEENPLLPQCAAESLRDGLTVDHGWTGMATIQGNDATAQCSQ